MNVLVAGDNQMALSIVISLMERHQVVCIHPPDNRAWHDEQLDAEIVEGELTSPQELDRCGVAKADAFIACSDSDEQNIVSCMAARRLGAKKTICVLTRRSFLTYTEDGAELSRSLGIDQVVRPIDQLAEELVSIVLVPSALEIQKVAEGRLALFRFAVGENARAVGRSLSSLRLPTGTRLVHVRRGDDFIVPRGDTALEPGDKVIAMGFYSKLSRLGDLFRKTKRESEEATVIGGGRVGRSVATELLAAGWKVTVVEHDRERCQVVSERTDALVLHGDGTDVEFLDTERIADQPVVIAVTNSDERNLLVALVLKQLGTARVVTRADRMSNEPLFERVGVDVVRSAKRAAIRNIVTSVDPSESEILAELEHGTACVLEITLPSDIRPTNLTELSPPAYAVVGGILRGSQTIVPAGQDQLLPNDQLFVFCAREDKEIVTEYFQRPSA